MATSSYMRESGGFIPSGLPSPAPSAPSAIDDILPRPRTTALKSGGAKETALVNYVEGKLREISGRFERRFQVADAVQTNSRLPGFAYHSIAEIASDLSRIVDIIWTSGTPSLQIPFLFNIANAFLDYLEPFPFEPEPVLKLFQKLDFAFSSLLRGVDIHTGEPLPGFETGRKVNMTEKVRLSGLVERTRVGIVELSGRREDTNDSDARVADVTDFTETEDTDAEDMDLDTQTGLRKGAVDLDVARVYQRTLADLSESLANLTLPTT